MNGRTVPAFVVLAFRTKTKFTFDFRTKNQTQIHAVVFLTDQIVLPVLQEKCNLLLDEQKIYTLLKNREMSSSAIVEATGFGKSKTVTILNKLVSEGLVEISGNGRGTKYRAIH